MRLLKEAGVQAPLGFWDPLGLSTSGNVSDYKRRREVELKHGTLDKEMVDTCWHMLTNETTFLPSEFAPLIWNQNWPN